MFKKQNNFSHLSLKTSNFKKNVLSHQFGSVDCC